jgi:hypothetical protein
MNVNYFDDDENVKAMRETAKIIGLTDLLVQALHESDNKDLIRQALRLLGAQS